MLHVEILEGEVWRPVGDVSLAKVVDRNSVLRIVSASKTRILNTRYKDSEATRGVSVLLDAFEKQLEESDDDKIDKRLDRVQPMQFDGPNSATLETRLIVSELGPGPLPDFELLVNYVRERSHLRRCVMCGRLGDNMNVEIPRQNKNVCRQCDKATWIHKATQLVFKWCKGCKRFQNIHAFQGKLAASKCDNCRYRGRLGYQRRVQRILI